MKLGLNLNVGLQQTLTPQQIQYLKLLQLPALQMEQHIRQEIEQNPMLEEFNEDGSSAASEELLMGSVSISENGELSSAKQDVALAEQDALATQRAKREEYSQAPETVGVDSFQGGNEPDISFDADVPDDADAFEFYKLVMDEDGVNRHNTEGGVHDDDDYEPFQIKDVKTFEDELLEQLHFLDITEEEVMLGEQIIGNLDDDGYLRRSLREVLDETNVLIDDENITRAQAQQKAGRNDAQVHLLARLNLKIAEDVLRQIQQLEPVGCGSRTVQECLVAQLRALPKLNAAQKLALEVLDQAYEPFTMKHYHVIAKQLEVTDEYLREALEVIRKLNPKPGTGSATQAITTIIPDFSVERAEDSGELLINVNDSNLPPIRVSAAYEKLKKEARYRKFNKDTRDWLRKKHDDAKFLLHAIRQRKATMLRVMTAIAGLQKGFFDEGPVGLRPLIYKDVADETGMDISTVCRIVNSKYVQTEFGIFDLRFFFSESLTNDDGEEVSTRIIKEKIKEIIDKESKNKPWSDDKLAKELKKAGFNVARRTVAKYREQLKIPVARLRREL